MYLCTCTSSKYLLTNANSFLVSFLEVLSREYFTVSLGTVMVASHNTHGPQQVSHAQHIVHVFPEELVLLCREPHQVLDEDTE